MLLTPELIQEIVKIIHDHHVGVAANLYGRDAVTAEQWEVAKRLGLVTGDDWEPVFEGLHDFGMLLAHLDQQVERHAIAGEEMSWEAFKAHVAKHPVPRTQQEYFSAEWNKRHGARLITDLGAKAAAQTAEILEAEAAQTGARARDIFRDITSARFGDVEAQQRLKQHGIDQGLSDDFFDNTFRATNRRIASDMGHALDDWTRDMQRVATTEGHSAINGGIATSFEDQAAQEAKRANKPVARILAFKLPRPDACQHCIRLHVDGGDNPRLYWLDEIQANGSNRGRKAADWRIVIPTTHPWCGCTLHRVPQIFVKRITAIPGWRSGQSAPSVIGPGGSIGGAP